MFSLTYQIKKEVRWMNVLNYRMRTEGLQNGTGLNFTNNIK